MYTTPIFIDTSTFISENYFRGHKLKTLIRIAKTRGVKLYIVDITKDEVKKNIAEESASVRASIRKFIGEIESSGKILKNLDKFKHIWGIDRPTVEDIKEPLLQKWENFISLNITEVICSDIASVTEVFRDYFNSNLPFQNGDKKNEFPDAFILNTIIKWCRINNTKVYVLSNDNDFLKFKHKLVNPLNLSDYLELTLKYEREKEQQISTGTNYIYNESGKVLKVIGQNYEDEIGYAITEKIERRGVYREVDYEKIDFKSVEIFNLIPIDYVSEDSTIYITYEVSACIRLNIDLAYDNYEFASYDHEDDIYFNVERDYESLDSTITVELQLDIVFEAENNEFYDEKIESVSELKIEDIDLGIHEFD